MYDRGIIEAIFVIKMRAVPLEIRKKKGEMLHVNRSSIAMFLKLGNKLQSFSQLDRFNQSEGYQYIILLICLKIVSSFLK